MLPLTQFAIKGIDADDAEMFLAAAEVVRAHRVGTGSNAGLIPPYDTILRATPPSAEDVEAISNVVVRYLSHGSGTNAASAVYVLGQIQNSALVPVLRDYLHRQLELFLQKNQVIGNLVCALTNHGEDVHSGGSYCVSGIDKNVADSKAYLQRFGITLPW